MDVPVMGIPCPWDRDWWDPDDYFIGGAGWAGGVIFNYSVNEVRQFLIDNGSMYLDGFHFDGLRYDEVTVIHFNGGDQLCRDLTSTLRYQKPDAIHIAEYSGKNINEKSEMRLKIASMWLGGTIGPMTVVLRLLPLAGEARLQCRKCRLSIGQGLVIVSGSSPYDRPTSALCPAPDSYM
jgi:hypothetical protein